MATSTRRRSQPPNLPSNCSRKFKIVPSKTGGEMRCHMADPHALAALKRRIHEEPAVPIECAAEMLGISTRTIRRHLYKFEVKHVHRHIFITVRSVARYLAQEQYQATQGF